MQNRKRKLWTHRLKKGYMNDNSVRIDTCAICRQKFEDYCLDCVANSHNACDQMKKLKEESENVWLSLLLLQSQNIFPFDTLILKTIYNYCLPTVQIKGCDVCILGKKLCFVPTKNLTFLSRVQSYIP